MKRYLIERNLPGVGGLASGITEARTVIDPMIAPS
jgi:hypothetical protein